MKHIIRSLILSIVFSVNLFAQTGSSIQVDGVASGSSMNGCNAITAILNVVSGTLACNPASVVNGSVSTAGRSILTIRDTITGASATSNFLNITGMFPASTTVETVGLKLALSTSASDSPTIRRAGLRIDLSPETVGSGKGLNGGTGIYSLNSSQSTDGTNSLGRATLGGQFIAAGSSTVINGGLRGEVIGPATVLSYGIAGAVIDSSGASPIGIGVIGDGGTSNTVSHGGFFRLVPTNSLTAPTSSSSAALVADNTSVAANIFEARDNGTAVFTIADGGQTRAIAGSATTPGLSFIAQTGTGLYQATNRMNVAIAQGDHWSFNSGGSISELQTDSTGQFSWSSTTPPTAADGDTGLNRVAAGVVGATSGSLASPGWLQNSAGEVALNADYTNATASFSSTALSVTVISGRTYNFSLNLTFADSTAADGAQFDFNGGSAAATNFRVHCMSTNAAGAILAQSNAAATALATANAVTLALTTQANLVCNGTFVPSGNGTFIVRAAQSAHTAGTLTVHRGSWLSVKDARPL